MAQGVSGAQSLHPHAIHVLTCLSCALFVLVLSPFSLSLTSTFSLSLSTCSLTCTSSRHRRGLKPLYSRTKRSIAPWRYTILSQTRKELRSAFRVYCPRCCSSQRHSTVEVRQQDKIVELQRIRHESAADGLPVAPANEVLLHSTPGVILCQIWAGQASKQTRSSHSYQHPLEHRDRRPRSNMELLTQT